MSAADRESRAPVLRGRRVVLRPVAPTDVATLRKHLQDPSVVRWWGPVQANLDVALDWLAADDETTVWTIEIDGAVAGSIQATEEPDPDYRHAGIDLFLGPGACSAATSAVRTGRSTTACSWTCSATS